VPSPNAYLYDRKAYDERFTQLLVALSFYVVACVVVGAIVATADAAVSLVLPKRKTAT
jgi:hypothetical protein